MTEAVLFAILQIFGVFLIGWLARHKGYIREDELTRWSRLVIDILFPMLIFHSIAKDFDPGRLDELWPLPLVGIGIILLGAGAGALLRRPIRDRPPELVRTFHHFCAINNYGFLPIIIVHNLLGPAGLPLLFFLNLGSNLGYWTVGVGLLDDADWTARMRNLVTPPLVALFLALFVCLTGLQDALPRVVYDVTGFVGAAAVPCMLLLIGASLYPLPRIRRPGLLAYLAVVRLVALPLLAIVLLRFLPLAGDVRTVALVVALMPASVSSTIITRRYGGDPDFAVRAVLVTTVLACATVPAGLWLVERL